ncbi:ATPASE EXPRESSION PROTEIN 3 [Salix viminalis]|uniref:ATPASE EXPRESSION PROTEIN 3 n=1 Tax=Salix viminalis TaxID=40686 RepID=A0A9Q0UHJ9_SALVM|nr:ATPASE EXPRESSION PROTEIN 3 [Salix viminalis]
MQIPYGLETKEPSRRHKLDKQQEAADTKTSCQKRCDSRVVQVMDLIIPTSHTHEGLCSFQYFNRDTTRRSSFAGARIRGNVGSTRKIHVGLRKLRMSRVFALSEVETFHSNGKLQNHDKPLNGHMGNGHVSSSSIEEFESNNHLRKLVRNGELEEGFRFLESMVYRGEIPDIIASTSLIRGFFELLNQLSSKGCSPVLITYNTVIDGLSKVGKTDEAVELLHEMRGKGLKPDVITYSSLIAGLSREGKVEEAIEFFHDVEGCGVKPNAFTYNSIMFGLCKAQQTGRAIDFLAYMISKGCKPTEVSYTILIEGIANEGLAKEALELLNELCSRGVVKKSSAEQVVVRL